MKKQLLIVSAIILTALPVSANQSVYEQADAELNRLWKSFPETVRNALRPIQREWIKSKERTCNGDYGCLTKMTQQRVRFFRGIKACLDQTGKIDCLTNGN